MTQRALILGVGGMDGSHLADLLLERGCEVHGVHRHTSTGNLERIKHLLGRPDFTLHRGDLTDVGSLYRIFVETQPTWLFNEADQDNVGWSHALPGLAARVTFAAVADVLEIVRQVVPTCRVFQPCSSTIFGDAPAPQNEQTPLAPMSPYAVSKAAALHLARMYRKVHGLHVSCGILFNHTSTRQSDEYLLHKICRGAVRIAAGKQEVLALGNLQTRVDIGCAKEYMEAAWLMLQRNQGDDFVIGTGTTFTVGQLAKAAMAEAMTEERVVSQLGSAYLARDPLYYFKDPSPTMQADTSKVKRLLGWEPSRTAADLIPELVRHYEREEE